MSKIVLDMEWNQPWPGSHSAQSVPLRGEIIQMGAVRLGEEGGVEDEFQVLVRPRYFRRLNYRVSKLTGIKEARLTAEGLDFREAIERFCRWCGPNPIFFTWGFDDIPLLRENLKIYGMDDGWTQRWYNAQMIFNAQTDGSSNQKALKTAMEMLNVEPSRPAHDALGDAYHTAVICTKLDLERGMEEYGKALKSHENGFHGADLPGCIQRKVFYGYPGKNAALEAMSGPENLCPKCGRQMLGSRWFSQAGRRYMDLATCQEHGRFLIRVRLSEQDDGTVRVSRLTYEADSEAAQSYERRAEKAEPEARPRRPRRRRSASRSSTSGEKKE